MAECWIAYRESAWLGVAHEMAVKVNLSDLAQGHERLESHDAFRGNEASEIDITERLSLTERRQLYRYLRTMQIGFPAAPAMGCDGSDHELTLVFAPLCRITCTWWVEVPPEWRGVREIVDILRRHGEYTSLYGGQP